MKKPKKKKKKRSARTFKTIDELREYGKKMESAAPANDITGAP